MTEPWDKDLKEVMGQEANRFAYTSLWKGTSSPRQQLLCAHLEMSCNLFKAAGVLQTRLKHECLCNASARRLELQKEG